MTARRSPRPVSRRRAALLAAAALALIAGPAAAAVECDRSREYPLTPRCGPHMIMVATFHPLRGAGRRGTTPGDAARELVYELREKGIPAYVWSTETKTERFTASAADGTEQRKVISSMKEGVSVLAGNFKAADDPKVQKGLAYIKTKFVSDSLTPVAGRGGMRRTKSGGFFTLTPGRSKSPFDRAFVTTNPLMDPADLRRLSRRRDPLLVRLNAGREYSLSTCPKPYSLVVAQFRGKTLTQVAGTKTADLGERIELSDDLDAAGKKAWELCQVLRQRGHEAYVWHERHRSLVTVGAFAGGQDPAAVRTAKRFAARPNGVSPVPMPQTIVVPETETDLRKARRYWLLDPSPYLTEVTKI